MSRRELWIALVAGMAGGGLVSLIHGGVALAAPVSHRVISAQRFTLVDGAGKVKGVWSSESNGQSLVMNAHEDKSSVGLGVISGQPLLYLMDANGNVRTSITLVKDEQTAMVSLADRNRRVRARLGGDAKDGESVINLWDAEGKPVAIP